MNSRAVVSPYFEITYVNVDDHGDGTPLRGRHSREKAGQTGP